LFSLVLRRAPTLVVHPRSTSHSDFADGGFEPVVQDAPGLLPLARFPVHAPIRHHPVGSGFLDSPKRDQASDIRQSLPGRDLSISYRVTF
jgi:hypothetical protein